MPGDFDDAETCATLNPVAVKRDFRELETSSQD